MSNRIGYARVSTTDQHTAAQHDALAAAGCGKVFTDKGISGKLASRPQWDACLAYLRPGDVLVVTKLDRLGRSVKHLVDLGLQLAERGIDLVVTQQGIDTTTPAGKLLFHLLAAIAEFEADLISERTKDGLAAARARGRRGGRPAKLSARQIGVMREMYASREHTIKEIAGTFGVSHMTVYRHLERETAAAAS
jgi:DNA invertase Pin-like site-specific DNA recombinase